MHAKILIDHKGWLTNFEICIIVKNAKKLRQVMMPTAAIKKYSEY